MKRKLADLAASIDARSPRERIVLLMAGLVLLALCWDMLLMQPLRAEQLKAQAVVGKGSQQVAAQKAVAAQLQAQLEQLGKQSKERQLQAARQELQHLDQLLERNSLQVISPAQMVRVLRDLCDRQNGLKLVSMENTEVLSVLNADANRVDPTNADSTSAAAPIVYKHGLRLEFTGDYFAVVKYLHAIEALDWNFLWDDFHISMQDYPSATVSLTLSTLSLHKDWIGA